MKCAKRHCDKTVAPHNQKYCSREHAPYAYLCDREDTYKLKKLENINSGRVTKKVRNPETRRIKNG